MVANRREQLEVDYLDQLSEKDKDFLNKFNEEFVLSNFKHPGKVLDDSQEAKRASYNANNARNRCIYTKAKVTGLLNNTLTEKHLSSFIDQDAEQAYRNHEDTLIEVIGLKNSGILKDLVDPEDDR